MHVSRRRNGPANGFDVAAAVSDHRRTGSRDAWWSKSDDGLQAWRAAKHERVRAFAERWKARGHGVLECSLADGHAQPSGRGVGAWTKSRPFWRRAASTENSVQFTSYRAGRRRRQGADYADVHVLCGRHAGVRQRLVGESGMDAAQPAMARVRLLDAAQFGRVGQRSARLDRAARDRYGRRQSPLDRAREIPRRLSRRATPPAGTADSGQVSDSRDSESCNSRSRVFEEQIRDGQIQGTRKLGTGIRRGGSGSPGSAHLDPRVLRVARHRVGHSARGSRPQARQGASDRSYGRRVRRRRVLPRLLDAERDHGRDARDRAVRSWASSRSLPMCAIRGRKSSSSAVRTTSGSIAR